MKQKSLQQKVENNLREGEKSLDFLSQEIQKSSKIKVGLLTLFASSLKEEQKRYSEFQKKYAVWVRENFVLRRELVFADDEGIGQKKQLLAMLEDVAKTVDSLFDSWEDSVEGHQTAQTNALKVTIPLVAVIISLLSFIIALLK